MVLITSLVLLLALTLLGLAAMQNTALEERMAGNLRSESLAFQSAEAALREGEIWLASQPAKPVAELRASSDDPLVWLENGPAAVDAEGNVKPELVPTILGLWWQFWSPDKSWAAHADEYGNDLAFVTDANGNYLNLPRPRYVIEEYKLVKDSLTVGLQQDYTGSQRYRLTARGVDPANRSAVILRSVFARRY
jgi:type IV pilus assembly protein PilX